MGVRQTERAPIIRVHRVSSASEKQKLFASAGADGVTWVVADVQSRHFLQEVLLSKRACLEESSVVIANELWKELLFIADPEYRLISEDLARSLVWEWVQALHLPWAKTPASARRILQQMEHLAPILAFKDGNTLLQEWFKSNPDGIFRWQHWYEVGKYVWQEFEKRKWALNVWIPSLLVQPEMPRPVWPRRLYFDLGVRASPVEMQLVRELARAQDIHVVSPKPSWADAFRTTIDAYKLVDEEPDPKTKTPAVELPAFSSKPVYRRFSTHLAEVKEATACVRKWLDAGIQADKIAVVSPDMEVYGWALKIYFEEEGIPLQKAATEPLHSRADVSRWLSEIRLRLNRFSRGDLEVHLFQDADSTDIPYDEFRRLFGRFYDVGDLSRSPELAKKLDVSQGMQCTQREFMHWSLRLCPRDADLEKIAMLVSEFSRDGVLDLALSADVWIGMLEDLAARLGLRPGGSEAGGVSVLNLGSTEWMPATHVCFLNASENVLRRWNDSPFTAAEASKLLRDLGFAVSSHEAQPSEFELCWLLNRPWQEVQFYFASSDFAGEALTPSRFWLLGAHANGQGKATLSPQACRWDEIQRAPLGEIAAVRGWDPGRRSTIESALVQDAGRMPLTGVRVDRVRLSASSVEQFQKCPFIFAAQRVFKLSDEPCLDLDLDRMSRGRLMHRIFAMLADEPFEREKSDQELDALVEAARSAEKIQFAEERLWPPLKRAHVRLAKMFLKMESQWRSRFPKTQTVARELPFEVEWNMQTLDWAPKGGGNGPVFSGRIDRIDSNGGGSYAMIDYKSSVSSLRNWGSWLDNDQLQLAIYSELLERGFTSPPEGEVEAAVYYVCKAESRSRGFHLKESSEELFAVEPRMKTLITRDKKRELFASVRQVIGETVEKIQQGAFDPVPKKTSFCQECSWNRLCRAPHLN